VSKQVSYNTTTRERSLLSLLKGKDFLGRRDRASAGGREYSVEQKTLDP